MTCLVLGGAQAAAGQGVGGGDVCVTPGPSVFRTLSQTEVDLLIKDVVAKNPQVAEQLVQDPEFKRGQLENLRELLAFASQALEDGLAAGQVYCRELDLIKEELIAVRFDQHMNKGRPSKPAFGYITPTQVSVFWNGGLKGAREKKFQRYIKTKKAILIANNPSMNDRELDDEEVKQAREMFAKIEIYAAQYKRSAATIPKPTRDLIAMQVKLQQAQFLARLYSDTVAARTQATEREIDQYIASRPELNSETKRAEAEKILVRAKNGEDFAKLANEFSQDPGNKGSDGVLQGGIYREVKKGSFVKPFEDAVSAIEAGQIHPSLVESDFGYHIIKLERKGDLSTPAGTYDARHILISTMIPNRADPSGRDVPVKTYAASEIEAEKQRKLIGEIVSANAVSVPNDFAVPSIAKEPVAKKKPARQTKKRPVRKRK